MSEVVVSKAQATWRSTTLGEVIAWASGGTPSKANPNFWGGAVPWLSEKSLKGFLRDYLLPKLLSGEVRVRDAARLIGTAA